jgi:hypothetical protein
MLSLAKNQITGFKKNCSIFFWAKVHQISALIFFLILTYTNNNIPWKK